MGREPKPVDVLAAEGKSHRTKDELKARREAEAAMLTGTPMRMTKEVKENKIATAEFRRLKKLLAGIGKDDDLYSRIINTHCILVAECDDIQKVRDQFTASKTELQEAYHKGELGDPEDRGVGAAEYYRLLAKIAGSIIDCDKQLMAKRKMLLDIDKENILTVQSALRSIPKKPEEKKKTGMAAFLEHRTGGG